MQRLVLVVAIALASAAAHGRGAAPPAAPALPASPAPPTRSLHVKRCRGGRVMELLQHSGHGPLSEMWGVRSAPAHTNSRLFTHCLFYQLPTHRSAPNTGEELRLQGSHGAELLELKKRPDCANFMRCRLIHSRNHHSAALANQSTAATIKCPVTDDLHIEIYGDGNASRCSLVRTRSFKRKRLKRSSEAEAAAELVYSFIEQAVPAGAAVALKCAAAGRPPPRFTWTLDQHPLPPHHGATISESRESGGAGPGGGGGQYVVSTLALAAARPDHAGRYACAADNAHGAVSHAARLNVYGPPYIRAMSPVQAVAGSDLTIWCPYYGFPIESVKWEGGAGADARYEQAEGRLTIAGVDRARDHGLWACTVTSPGGELARREVQVSVVSPPVLSPLAFPGGLRAADRAQLTCTVTSGDMPVYFSWLKDQMPISSALQVEERGAEFYSMLLFKSLSAAHSGVYTCVVTNSAGKANASADLAIKVPPYWHLEPADVSVLLNSSVTVSCEARGHPPPTIFWTKITGSGSSALGGVSEPAVLSNGSLRVEAARPEHAARYRCAADNGVPPPLAKTLTIHVNEPARFATPAGNVSARRGEAARLACAARGDAPLQAAWSRAGHALPDTDYRMSISETRSAEGLRSELVIERAERRDSAVYRCHASNPYGRADHFVHLAVQEPPEPPGELRVVEASARSVRLQWRRPYDGQSPVRGYVLQYRRHDAARAADHWPDAHTYNVSVPAAPAHAYSDEEGATIPGLEPATAYLVRARTVTAQWVSAPTRALLALTLHEPPARAPLALRAAPARAALQLDWQPPPAASWNGELLGYTVWWWAAAEGAGGGAPPAGGEFATLRGHHNHYTIEGLQHYTRYTVSVRAFNSAGAGPGAAAVSALTLESVPSEGPRALRCRAVSPHSVKAEWSPPPPHTHHGALLGYKLLYRPEYTADWVEWEVQGGEAGGGARGGAEVKRVAAVETLLLALRPHTNYTVQALAYTAAGDGLPAPPVHCTTHQDVPGPPAAVKVVATSMTSLAVSWLPPNRPNGHILYYTVFHRELGRERPPQTTTVQAEDGELSVGLGGTAELRSLAEGASYEAWVAAHSGAGQGEPSPPHTATTTSRVGAKVISFGVWARVQCGRALRLSCAWRGDGGVRARWLRAGRPVTHDPRAHLTPHGHLAIHEVDASTCGNYTCSARNAYGAEEAWFGVECAAPPAAPALALSAASHTEATLAWRTTHHPAAPPHGYTVWWRRVRAEAAGEAEERRLEAGAGAAGGVLRALACGAVYAARVVAHSRAGSSPPSAPLLVNTLPPVRAWAAGDTDGDGAEAAVWSNSSALAVDVRRAVRCGAALLRLQWRPVSAHAHAWTDADLSDLQHTREVVIGGLSAGAWHALRLWTATASARHHALLYAATTTHAGERLRRPASFSWEEGAGGAAGGAAGGLAAAAAAASAALALLALLLVLLARRSAWRPCGGCAGCGGCSGCGGSGCARCGGAARRCSHSGASTDKSVCAEQQNIANCRHDYKHDKLSPHADVYEISPYATFAVGGGGCGGAGGGCGGAAGGCGGAAGGEATLDHSLQFRTFGLRDNEAAPERRRRAHRPHRAHEKHHSSCELQQVARYERGRARPPAAPSAYCTPLAQHGGGSGGVSELYAGDSSAESGPASLCSRTHHEHS